jgi:hypothetical protein
MVVLRGLCVTEPPQKLGGLPPKIILGDSQRSENGQTHTYKHTIPYMKFKLKLLQIKCYVLEFTKDKTQKMLQKIIRVFAKAFISHDRHTLFALEENGLPQTIYTCESLLEPNKRTLPKENLFLITCSTSL